MQWKTWVLFGIQSDIIVISAFFFSSLFAYLNYILCTIHCRLIFKGQFYHTLTPRHKFVPFVLQNMLL